MKARKRTRARRLAFQAVFMLDARNEWDIDLARRLFVEMEPVPSEDVRAYALELVATVIARRDVLDPWLDTVHPHWRLKRMAGEDRAMLRLGAAELWYFTDVPPRVVIDEWVELSKTYCGADSPRFINGVLDRAWHHPPEGIHARQDTTAAG